MVSNCDQWTTYGLVPAGACPALDEERKQWQANTAMCGSFMHLHLGIDAQDLPVDMPPQWTVCADWSQPIDAPGNVIVVSVPSLLDPSLAPPGRHVIHAYTAGNEPYQLWAKYDKKETTSAQPLLVEDSKKSGVSSLTYEQFKEERATCLW